MAKKRKSSSSSTTTATAAETPATKQQKKQQQPPPAEEKVEEQQPPLPPPQVNDVVEKQPEHEDEDLEEEVEEEEVEEIEEEVEEEDDNENDENANNNSDGDDDDEDDDDDDEDDPISSLIDPFTKDQLLLIVREAAEKHADVASRVRKLADQDVVHRKIFVHGLGWDTTAETLVAAFKEYGDIEDCKAVADKLTGKSKGYGFILFKTRAGARNALKEPQKTISGRTASCQLAVLGPVGSSGGGSGVGSVGPGTGGFPQSEYTQRKIYISNVSAEIEPGKLTAYFGKYGEIEEGPLGIDKNTGKFKGFCLFVYKSVESAKKALEEPHKQFEGHTLHCQRAIDGPKHGKGGHHSGGGGGGGGAHRRGENTSVAVGGVGGGFGGVGAGLNPALGQALTALLASQGAGLGLNNLLGTLGAGVGGVGAGGVGHLGQGGYGGQAGIGPGLGGYGGQGGGLQSAYPSQQMGKGGHGRSQHGYNGPPYGGH
ncbi:hypothetical protein vseg_007779 [Gypsophila vaccaria]